MSMEAVGVMGDDEWSSFNAIYLSSEEADFMAQLLRNCSLPSDLPNNSNVAFSSSAYWPAGSESDVNMASVEESSMYSSDETSANMHYCFLQGSSYSTSTNYLFPISSHDQQIRHPTNSSRILIRNGSSIPANYYASDHEMNADKYLVDGGNDFLNQDVSSDSSMECGGNLPEGMHLQLQNPGQSEDTNLMLASQESLEDKTDKYLSEITKKRPQTPLDVQNNKRMIKAKNNDQKHDLRDHHDTADCECSHSEIRRQSSSCLSEDEANAGVIQPSSYNLRETNTALNLNGKTRASRGSATDPQSLYARKRREKINERLRILQNLVPNGTKVDISTMLEEAVHYVKFLQLQIKLLSSDDLWIYAPIAYNGMNLGLDLKIDVALKS